MTGTALDAGPGRSTLEPRLHDMPEGAARAHARRVSGSERHGHLWSGGFRATGSRADRGRSCQAGPPSAWLGPSGIVSVGVPRCVDARVPNCLIPTLLDSNTVCA